MSHIANSVIDLVGNTPLVRLNRITEGAAANGRALEFRRTGLQRQRPHCCRMIAAAEKAGKISKDTIILEPTSGNTGIAPKQVRRQGLQVCSDDAGNQSQSVASC